MLRLRRHSWGRRRWIRRGSWDSSLDGWRAGGRVWTSLRISRWPMVSSEQMDPAAARALAHGVAIPAHPLALTSGRKLDERRQVALTRYYCDAGAGGVAVGVHTTQFAIRDPRVGLYAPVLKLAAAAIADFERESGKQMVKVAGICGVTAQAVGEAAMARDAGYDIGLLSLAAL